MKRTLACTDRPVALLVCRQCFEFPVRQGVKPELADHLFAQVLLRCEHCDQIGCYHFIHLYKAEGEWPQERLCDECAGK